MGAVVAVAVFAAAYALIATEKLDRAVVALGGAGLVLAFQLVSGAEAFHSERLGVEWEVIFLLLGMMLIVAVLQRTGVFEYLAIWAAKRSRGRPFPILVALVGLTAVASALLDNVTTVLLLVPVTILVCERLGIPPVPFLIAEVLAANIGGTATLVGDPPNIIIAAQAGLSYTDFLLHLAPWVLLLMLVFVGMARWLFRKALVADPRRVRELLELDEREAITDPGLLVRALLVLGLVTAAFVLHGVLHYDASVIALLGAGLLLLLIRRDPKPLLAEVEWGTLAFFAGLFVMVGALINTGVIDALARATATATGGSPTVATSLLLGVSAVLSAIVDNIPYVTTMAPVTGSLIDTLPAGGDHQVLWWALALGADLGGNATAIGASANVVVLGLAARAGHPISFWTFTRYGLPVAAATVALSLPYLLIRYILLG
jgi:Na+/H+ antiporter NhaD/arsenite permease-like protein